MRLCPYCHNPISDAVVDQLQAENARLRSCLTDAAENARLIMGENAKLRELVQELYEDQCADGDQWKYRDRMRELGVEVDE